jgi:glycerate dehydrogenase
MRAVFLDRSTIDSSIDFSSLENAVDELLCYPNTYSNQVVERSKDFDIVITNKVHLGQDILAKLPQLKLICVTATGTNNIDLIAAEELNVQVKNVAEYSTRSVSQHVFAYLLNYSNQVNSYLQLNQAKPWHKSEIFCQFDKPINELAGLKVGIVGYGALGKSVAKIAESFDMTVLISERAGANKLRPGRVSFEQVLSESDVISLHCPLTEATENLVNKTAFNKMKKGCVLINTARGPIVNSIDLAEALNSGKLSHAIIDVLETEPPEANHPLLKNDIANLTLTHHIAWGSLQAQQRLMDCVAENICKHMKLG